MAAFLAAPAARRLQAAFADRLAAAARRREFRTVPTDNLHVTIRFLGDIAPAVAAEVLVAVQGLDAGPLTVQVTGFGGFPRPAAARVAVAELAPRAELEAWWAALAQRFGAGERGFRPHVTLARSRRPVRFARQPLDEPLRLDLAPPTLFRSDQSDSGVRYRPVSATDLE